MTDQKPLFIGVDDGYAETKVVFADGTRFRMPSHARAGRSSSVSLVGTDLQTASYMTDEGEFVVGKVDHPDPTSSDDYPTSAMNRVIVAHALRQAGVPSGARLFICTGLPVKKFYKGVKPNEQLINQKTKNLLKNDVRMLPAGTRHHLIERHVVGQESVGAWWDFILERKEKGARLVQNAERRNQRTAVVDVGGRTTDIVVIKDMNCDLDRSSTIEAGMLTVARKVADELSSDFSTELNSEQIEQALTTGMITVWNEPHNVSHVVDAVMQATIASIQSEVKRRLGTAGDIAHVLMVGGTIECGRRYFEGWFKNQHFVDAPGFANASGFQKFAELYLGSKENGK